MTFRRLLAALSASALAATALVATPAAAAQDDCSRATYIWIIHCGPEGSNIFSEGCAEATIMKWWHCRD